MVTTTESDPFLDALRRKQAALGLSGNQFARTIGVSPALYSRVVSRGRPVSLRFAQAAVQAYPDLFQSALSFFGPK